MPSAEPFADGIQFLQEHVQDLRRQSEAGPKTSRHLLEAAFETMNSAIEELRVAEEELRQQNEALVAAHDVVETWRHHYQDLFESAPDAYLVTDLDGIVQDANQAAVRLLELSKRFLMGKPLTSFIPDSGRPAFRQLLLDMMQVPDALEREIQLKPRLGALFEAALTISVIRAPKSSPTGLRWLIRDTTHRIDAEAERCRLLVHEVNDYAIFLMNPEGRIINWNRGAESIFGYAEAEVLRQPAIVLFTPEDRAAGVPDQEMRNAALTGRAADERWHVRRDGSRFWATGVMTALRDKSGRLRWYAKVLRDATPQKNEEERLAQVYAREHQIAATFQLALLPVIAEDTFPGLSLACLYEAAWKEAQVGGDFFDAFALDGDQVALVVGDVSGKGLAAAAHTAEVKYALRAFLRESPAPAQALSRLNAFIHDNHRLNLESDNAFLTLGLLIVTPATGEVTAACAGVEPPLILRANGTAEPMAVTGSLLGLERNITYEAVTVTLGLGDTVLMVTDGITEARKGSEFLDYEGLVHLAQEVPKTASPNEIGRAVLDGARAYAGGALSDDACLLLARRV